MKRRIMRQARVQSVTVAEGPYVRVQAFGVGSMDAAQIYFSVRPDEAPTPGQVLEFQVEWEAPAG